MDATVIDRRERILSAASALIVRSGLQFSMSEVAKEAGVAIGSIYHYFQSKDDMVRAIYDRLTARIVAAVVVEHDPETPHAMRIRRYIDDYMEFVLANPQQAVLFEYLSSVPPMQPGELERIFAPLTSYTSRLMTEAHAAGVLKDYAPGDLGAFLGGGIRNMLKWRRSEGRKPDAAERALMAEMCWSAIRA